MSGVLSPRAVTIFLSCPGDMHRAKEELTEVVYAVANHFHPFGIHIAPWRYDLQAVPSAGPDGQTVVNSQIPVYDIYVGLLCSRVGTPTRKAAGGTLEEFDDARKRFLETGRPHILFYFCSEQPRAANSDDEKQLAQVREFRTHFPGLFGTFHTVEELGALFRDHLLDLILRQLTPSPPRPRAWATSLAEILDNGRSVGGYFDRTSQSVDRVLEKLQTMFDLSGVLNSAEWDTLVAAAYLRVLAQCGCEAEAGTARSTLRQVPQAAWLEEAAVEVAGLVPVIAGSAGAEGRADESRWTFLAALLTLGEVLDLDREAIAGDVRPPPPPREDADLSCWLAYCTRRLIVQRPGLVRFEVLVSRGQVNQRQAISRAIALVFEAKWQRLRPILAANGIAVSRAPIELAVSATIAPLPSSVLSRLEAAADLALTEIPGLLHLSGSSPTVPDLDGLLPLPRSAVKDQLTFTLDPERAFTVRLTRSDGSEIGVVRPMVEGCLVVPSEAFPSDGTICRWALREDYGDFDSVIASGDAWALSPSDRIRWELAAGEPSHALQSWSFALGLWNELMAELWPKLLGSKATRSEALLIYDVLQGCYDWLRQHTPASGQIDRIRNALNWTHTTFLDPVQASRPSTTNVQTGN